MGPVTALLQCFVTQKSCAAIASTGRKSLRILFLTNAHNSLSQRLYLELAFRHGHSVVVELARDEAHMIAAVADHNPGVIICPFLTKRVPEVIWANTRIPCWIVHPGIQGDRGISAIDWALANGVREWGVTVLQAVEEMDAGDIWATRTFPVPSGCDGHGTSKSWLYQNCVVPAAVACVLEAVDKFQRHVPPCPLNYDDPAVKGRLMPPMKPADRAVDFSWSCEDVVKRLRVSGA